MGAGFTRFQTLLLQVSRGMVMGLCGLFSGFETLHAKGTKLQGAHTSERLTPWGWNLARRGQHCVSALCTTAARPLLLQVSLGSIRWLTCCFSGKLKIIV